MATRRIEIGWAGVTVMHNLPRFRGLRRMTMGDLSERLTALGRPMSVPTLSAVENGKRRIDVDDLVHLALALDVSPIALLMPATESLDDDIGDTPGAPDHSPPRAIDWWQWLRSEHPLWEGPATDPHDVETWRRSVIPPWARKASTDG
ncbi:helix-turn-helix transcriptional regulator [Mycobacterium sp. M1]|uniref:Helix-turn-helix transcriptional regulator n=1 Tax=Mycolicibacter acidiphilus TaxID=2835306 RepID=A0ABS5REI8_9MYCO|nr:helix-turn-helix transcriptional regulator [Mycolicibacter acidiphilus]MBS9532604.1 helix-turn-helix transcriptional regulator [Mycolicibacter acidiphilus]